MLSFKFWFRKKDLSITGHLNVKMHFIFLINLLFFIVHVNCRSFLRLLKDSTHITRAHLDTQSHRAPQNPTLLRPHTRAATTEVHPVPQTPGRALKHMEIQQSNQVSFFLSNKYTHWSLLWILFFLFGVGFDDFFFFFAAFPVLMVEQNRNGDSSGGRIQSFLSACSATLCCCCLWNLLGQCYWVFWPWWPYGSRKTPPSAGLN